MYERIVVGVSQTETARRAVDHAAALAEMVGAELHLVLSFDPYWDRIEPTTLPATAKAKAYLEELAAELPVEAVAHPVPGDPDEGILRTAEELDADLIVVGNKGMRGAGRVLGSVPNSIAHHAHCSVLIVATT